MNPKMIWANLGVSDLDRTTEFYTKLGFKSNGRSADLTSFLVGENDFVIHFFLKSALEPNMKGPLTDTQHSNEIVFTLSARSKGQAFEWSKEVEPAGGKLISPAEEFGEGYYGFLFADPDGHKFNVFYMDGL